MLLLVLGQFKPVRWTVCLKPNAMPLHTEIGSVLCTSMAVDSHLILTRISIRRRISRAHMINVLTSLNSARITESLRIANKRQINQLVKLKQVLANGLLLWLLSPAISQIHAHIGRSSTTKWKSEKSAQAKRPKPAALWQVLIVHKERRALILWKAIST